MPDFEAFDGTYRKDWYTVRLPDGEIIQHCWPNAGSMNETGGDNRTWGPGECEVKLSDTHPLDGQPIEREL